MLNLPYLAVGASRIAVGSGVSMQDSPVFIILLPLALVIIMLGLGLSLTVQDFRNVLKAPIPLKKWADRSGVGGFPMTDERAPWPSR